jgi:hypothetical protein
LTQELIDDDLWVLAVECVLSCGFDVSWPDGVGVEADTDNLTGSNGDIFQSRESPKIYRSGFSHW